MTTQTTVPAENKMGTMPLGRLLLSMALPLAISMLVQALYNVVDSIYISKISESAVTALSLAFPVQNLMIGFATGIGVGMATSIPSHNLGEVIDATVCLLDNPKATVDELMEYLPGPEDDNVLE